jgi:signal transduction histidine kinase
LIEAAAAILTPSLAVAKVLHVATIEARRILRTRAAAIEVTMESQPLLRAASASRTHAKGRGPSISAPLHARSGETLGRFEVSSKIRGSFDDGDAVVLRFLSGITALAAENAYRLERAQQLDHAKDEFMALLSHELRTPLNAIVGWTHLLRSGALNAEEAERAIAIIDRNARLQTRLISDVMDLTRIVSGRLELDLLPIRPALVVAEAIESLRSDADAKSLRIRKTIDAAAGPVIGDAARLRQIVWNLISNAIKFTPVGGKVYVQLTRSRTHARIRVMDTGIGISPQLLPYVFDRFRQADATSARSNGGLGLGLTLVRHLTEMHGGEVEALSRGEGRGATFRVRLPLAAKRAAGASAQGRPRARRHRPLPRP